MWRCALVLGLASSCAGFISEARDTGAGGYEPRQNDAGHPEPPGGDAGVASFQLLSPTAQTAPFSVGMAFARGAFPTEIGVLGATAQAVIKTRWPDGSAKLAIVSGSTALAANAPTTVTLTRRSEGVVGARLSTSDLGAALTAPVTIDAAQLGSASWSGPDWGAPFVTWVEGPLMSSWVYRKPIGTDAHLSAWLEVRLYASGAVELLPWVENGLLLVPGPTNKSATFRFTLGGVERFNQVIDLPHHCRTPLLDGPALSHWLGTDPDLSVKHDARALAATGLVPQYFASTPDDAVSVTGLPNSFSPLQRGSFSASLGSVGGNVYVGLLPEWDALYLTNGSRKTYKGVLFNAYSAGRYGFIYRDETTFRAPRLASHPTLNIREPSPGWETTPVVSGTPAPAWTIDHQPSVGTLAYLITGAWYHLDTVQMVASTNALFVSSTTRENRLGVYKSQYAGSARLVAWTWRALAQAAALTPDTDTELKGAYVEQLTNNINAYHARYIAQPSNPQGFIQPAGSYGENLNGSVAAGATATLIPVVQPGLGYNGAAGDGHYVGFTLSIGAEQRTVTGYVSSTNTLTVSPAFSGAPAAGTSVQATDGQWWDAPWMQDYVTAVWGWVLDMGCGLDLAALSKMRALFTWKAQSIVGRLGSTGADEYLYRDYAPYEMVVSPSRSADWETGTGPWFSSWGQLYAAEYAGRTNDASQPAPYASNGPRVGGSLRNHTFGNVEGPAAQALPAIAQAVHHRIAGAPEAYQRLISAPNWPDFVNALHQSPVWAIAPSP